MEKSNISTLVDLAQRMMQKMGDNMEGDTISEEMITYRVKGMQKPEEQKFIRSAKMMGLKITMDKGKKDTVIVMSGTKKKLRDFDAVARGKSSYGDPSTITHFDEK
jgi:peroxiredoxin family protein